MKFKVIGIIILICLSSVGNNVAIAKTAAVIFDCDGVLVDTEYLKYQAWQQTLSNHAINFTIEEYMPLIGLSSKKIMAQIIQQKKLTINADELIKEKNNIYDSLQLKGVKPIPEAINFLNQLIKNKNVYHIKIGIASSAPRKQILENLKQIKIDPKNLDAIVSGSDDLKHINDPSGTNKPKPYIYSLIAKQLSAHPEDCVVFEDSAAGVIAAADAGMIVIAVPNEFTKNHDFSRAKIVANFANMTNDIMKLIH